jgi:hypothetical protein
LKGRSATKSFSPEATDHTTALESSPNHLSVKERVVERRREGTDAYQTAIVRADGEMVDWFGVALKNILKLELHST